MPEHGLAGSVARWLYGTLGASFVDRRCLVLSYEKLVGASDPGTELARIVEHDHRDVDRTEEGPGGWDHAIGGNPIRFRSGTLDAVAADERWRQELHWTAKAMVWSLCIPAAKATDLALGVGEPLDVGSLAGRTRLDRRVRVDAGAAIRPERERPRSR